MCSCPIVRRAGVCAESALRRRLPGSTARARRVPAVKSLRACVCFCAARQQNPNVNAQLLALQRLTQAGPRRIGPYSSQQSILMVGEGDFSFALVVASAVGGDRLVCTSLDKATQLQVKYDNKVNGILGTLHGLGAKTHHNVDATNLKVCARAHQGFNARLVAFVTSHVQRCDTIILCLVDICIGAK